MSPATEAWRLSALELAARVRAHELEVRPVVHADEGVLADVARAPDDDPVRHNISS